MNLIPVMKSCLHQRPLDARRLLSLNFWLVGQAALHCSFSYSLAGSTQTNLVCRGHAKGQLFHVTRGGVDLACGWWLDGYARTGIQYKWSK